MIGAREVLAQRGGRAEPGALGDLLDGEVGALEQSLGLAHALAQHPLQRRGAGLGAKPPRRVPVWLGRLATGEVGISMMTRIRGVSNAKAKRELGWAPAVPTYRDGIPLMVRANS